MIQMLLVNINQESSQATNHNFSLIFALSICLHFSSSEFTTPITHRLKKCGINNKTVKNDSCAVI